MVIKMNQSGAAFYLFWLALNIEIIEEHEENYSCNRAFVYLVEITFSELHNYLM